MFAIKFPLDFYRVPNVQEVLLYPESYPNLGDLSPMEKTFKADNKKVWRQAAMANLYHYIKAWDMQREQEMMIMVQGSPATKNQLNNLAGFKRQRTTAFRAFREAKKRSRTGFGIVKTECPKRLDLITWLTRVITFDKSPVDTIFKRHCVNAAVNEFREFIYRESKDDDTANNIPFLKRLIADINTGHEETITLYVAAELASKAMKAASKGKCAIPVFEYNYYSAIRVA